MEVSGQLHAPASFIAVTQPPVGGPHSQSGFLDNRIEKKYFSLIQPAA